MAEGTSVPRPPWGCQDQLWLSATHGQEEIPWLKGNLDVPRLPGKERRSAKGLDGSRDDWGADRAQELWRSPEDPVQHSKRQQEHQETSPKDKSYH